MWPQSRVSELLKISYPLIQAPMAGGATTPELVANVSEVGALGSLGAGYMSPPDIKQAILNIRKRTSRPFAVNLFIPEKHHATRKKISRMQEIIAHSCPELQLKIEEIAPPYAPNFDEQLQVIIDEKVPIFSFTFGIPHEGWLQKLKNNGTILIGTATNLEEAILLEKKGIDIIVAQGSEGGGHRGTFIGEAANSLIETATLVKHFTHVVKIPVIAAGGIMDGATIISQLRIGASGVQIGTAFLSCPECGIHPQFKHILLNSSKDNTTLTRVFSGKLARGIMNAFIKRMDSYANEVLDYPIQNALTRPMRKEAEKQNATDFMSLWAGQYYYLSQGKPVRELLETLIQEVNAFYRA